MKRSIHWLLVFIPIAVILDHAGNVPPPVIFFSAALAIMPIAVVIVRSTEQIAMRTGDAVGGLLNATFGNAPELIIVLVALKPGYPDMVRASIIGDILARVAEGTGKALGMSQIFIGIVLLAIIGGAAESVSAIALARKDKMDLSVGIAVGSSIQIALFVAPVLVFASYLIGPQPLELSFRRAEVGSLFIGVFISTCLRGRPVLLV